MRLLQIPICMALMILPPSLAQAQTLTPHTITVTGTATIKAAPDTVVITVNLTSSDKSAAAALQASKDTAAHLMQILRPFNIPASQIQTSNTNINIPRPPVNFTGGQNPPPIANTQVNNRVLITVDDLASVPAILDAVAQTGGVQSISELYSLKNRAALEDKAKVEAIANAKRQADMLAAATDQKIDKMIAISTTMAVGNYLSNLGLPGLAALQLQDGQIAVTQQVVVEYGLQ